MEWQRFIFLEKKNNKNTRYFFYYFKNHPY